MREQNHARPRSRRRRLLALEPTRARRPSAASPSRTSKATTKSSASRLKALVQGQPSPGSSPARPGAARKTLNRLRLHPLPCCTAFLRSSHTPKHSLAPTPSTSSLQPPYANLSNAKASPAAGDDPFASRRSLRSQGSSVGGESVFGTPPVGVVGKTRPREVIRVERDYSSGEVCQLWSGWIWELEGRVSPTDYQNTLNELNEVLASAHDPTKSFIDNCLAVLTLYLSSLLVSSHYERVRASRRLLTAWRLTLRWWVQEMRRLHSVLARANSDLYNPVGLNLLSPCENAFLFLEIEYY
ncbi:Golgin subfamily A member 7/ERF4 family-domain-containing protein [Rhodotorula diobovata]|uniref:Ras modification protein ERF4 n=1 Tax=Rhodotorula diobovata TaxID=5288 RepID=A0A5C5FLY1_9BASI|nr:Golgin subfamily A member 7/ERF4 family-domain-containing protein [Rhodotorula diobovata]